MLITVTLLALYVGFSAVSATTGSVALKIKAKYWSGRLSIYVGGAAPGLMRSTNPLSLFFEPALEAHANELAYGCPFAAVRKQRPLKAGHSPIVRLVGDQPAGRLFGPNRICRTGL